MPKVKRRKRLISLAVTMVFLAAPLVAQQKRQSPPKKPAAQTPAPKPAAAAPTFDTLLAADSYRVYAEVRNVGQLIHSPAVTDLLDPVMNLGSPPTEFKGILKWLNAQADALAASRMLVASWATKPNLPAFLVAIEFASVEEAQKFDPKLRRFIPTLLPTPTPTPTPPAIPGDPAVRMVESGSASATPQSQSGPALPPYHIKQSGSLLLISDKPFAFKDLMPRGSKSLAEDQNFATARNRFAAESVFVYVDTKSIKKEQDEQLKKAEEEYKKRELEAANRPTAEASPVEPDSEINPEPVVDEMPFPTEPAPDSSERAELVTAPVADESTATLSGSSREAPPNLGMLPLGLLFGGQSTWPDAVGAAVALEGDAYVLRVLILNDGDTKGSAIPFVPQLISGPALVPESPNLFPADTDFFVALSLDYPQVYEGMVKALTGADEMARRYGGRPVSAPAPESPFATYEKALGLKIKDDLLPLLGNEIALALPPLPKKPAAVAEVSPSPEDTAEDRDKKSPPPSPPEPSPVIAISVKDKDAVRRLLPKIVESFGFKGASLLAQTEKRDDTEITSYAGVFSYAFIGDFLVVSPDPVATRHVVDSFLARETLSSNSHFRNTIRWQPRQLLGQVYVAPDLVERYYPLTLSGTPGNDRMRDFLTRLSPVLDPLSYALTNDGLGPLHELHVPRNMLMLLVAGLVKDSSEPPLAVNESRAQSTLRTVHAAQATYQATQGNGRFGTLDELTAAGLVPPGLALMGYKLEIRVSADKFEATAVPIEYGTTGSLSFFIDESGVLRGGDRGGGPATVADQPVN